MNNFGPEAFLKLSRRITNHYSSNSDGVGRRRFLSIFGVTPSDCTLIWNHIEKNVPDGASPTHLFWALFFLKNYCVEEINRVVLGADEKTLRKWIWIMVDAIARIKVIKWNSRRQTHGSRENVSIDGVDFEICEPTPFSRKWYSFKHNGPGLRYEIGLSIKTGNIVWGHGGVPCGKFSDLKLARDVFVNMLDPNEKAIADDGYKDDTYFINPRNASNYRKIKRLLARHETVNKRIKQWRCLGSRFRHPLHRHPRCFHAVLNITQIRINNGSPLFDV